MTRAFEFVIVPLLFAFLGYLLDGLTHTRPLFALLFGLTGVVGCGLKTFYVYRWKMAQAEEGMPWKR